MTPLEALAGRLYEAARHTGGRIAAGAEPWERVGPKGREAWLAVATEARAALSPRVVTTAAEFDTLPVGSVLVRGDDPWATEAPF